MGVGSNAGLGRQSWIDSTGRKLVQLASVEAVTKCDSEGVVAQPQQDWREALTVQTSANLAAHRTGINVVCARPLLDGTLLTCTLSALLQSISVICSHG